MNETSVKEPPIYTSKNVPDIISSLILITLGVIILLNNLGFVSWSIWYYVFLFWPAIFIFIGLNMISDSSYLLRFVTSIIGIIIFSFILIYSLYSVDIAFNACLNKNFPGFKKIYNSIPLNMEINNPNYNPFESFRV